jgi:hypothetical protein
MAKKSTVFTKYLFDIIKSFQSEIATFLWDTMEKN